jgi:glycosyltransferase involved in cell wall biosynthesis
MRVVFVNRYFFPDLSATSQMLSDLACSLARHGIEVHVVCSDRLYEDATKRLPTEEIVRGVRVHRARTSSFGRGRLIGRAIDYASFYVTSSGKLFRLLRRGDTVVAKTDPPLISIVVAALAWLRGARLVNWLQDVFPEVASHLGANPLPAWLDEHLKRLRDYSLSIARTNVVLGTRMREHLERRGIPSERIRIIENWADGDAVVPKAVEASQLRMQLGIADEFVVGYSGNLGRAHEFETLLAAAERLRADQNVVFLMIGGGAKMEQLQAAVAAKQLANFRFLPYQPREMLADSLAAADVHLACLLPQLEGLIVPSKFYGILAAGRPTVFIGDTDGELARIIRDTECGMAVAVGDDSTLVECIQRLRADPSMRERMGSRARALFIERYTVGRAAQQWMAALQPEIISPALS